MYEQTVFSADLERYLPDRLYERLRFYVADRAAYLGNDDVGICLFAYAVNEFFYFVGNVRNNLYRRAEILSSALFVEHTPVYLARSKVGVFVQILVDKSLVMTEIEVCLRAVFGNVHFAVLIRTHRTRVDVDIRVEFLRRDFKPSCLEKSAQRRRRNTFA